jgi:hypothetical protein
VAADAPVLGEAGELCLDRRENPGQLAGRAEEVLGREHPERERRDPKLRTPGEHVVELLGAKAVGEPRVGQAALAGVAAAAVEDDADVAGDGTAADLAGQAPCVEAVEEADHASTGDPRDAVV